MLAFSEVDLTLAAGGLLLLCLVFLVWKVEADTRGALEAKRFDQYAEASLEQRYLDSHSFRGLYNSMHEVINQPPFMVAGMISASVIAILIGTLYVFHPDIALPYIVAVSILGAVWYYGDALESTLMISYASKSALRKSDRDNLACYRELVRLGKYHLLAMGICLLALAFSDASGFLSYLPRPLGVLVPALAVCLVLVATWRSTLAANRPLPR